MGIIKRLLKKNILVSNSLMFVFSRLLLKACSFLLIPLYTAFLTTADYGMTNIATSFTNSAIILVTFNLSFATSRFYAEYSNDKYRVKRLFGTLSLFSLLCTIVFGVIAFVFKNAFLTTIFKGFTFAPSYILIISALPFHTLYNLYTNILSGMLDAKRNSIVSIVFFFLQLGLNCLFVVYYKLGADGVFIASIISFFIGTVWMIIDMVRRDLISFCLDKKILKETLIYSIPIIPHSFSGAITQLLSRVFIGSFNSLSTVGIFGLATQFSTIAEVVQGGVSSAYQPWLYNRLENKDESWKAKINDTVTLLLWALGFMFVGLSLFSQEAVLIMAEKSYSEAWKIVPLMVLIYVIKTPYYFYVAVLFYNKKASRFVFVISVVSNLVNVILSWFFVSLWGMYGSVLADAIGMVIIVGAVYIMSKRYEDINLHFLVFIRYLIVTSIFIGVGMLPAYFFWNSLSWLNLVYKLVILLIYLSMILISQRRKIKDLIQRRRKNANNSDML